MENPYNAKIGKTYVPPATVADSFLRGTPAGWVEATNTEIKTLLGLALTQTANAVGFSISGGTTSKQLTVALDANVSGTNTGDVSLATNHGLGLTNQVLNMGTPSSVTGASTNSVTTTTHTHAIDLTAPPAIGETTPSTGKFTTLRTTSQFFDSALSADGKYSGIVEAGTIGTAALAFGESVYLASTGKWEKTKADAAATAKDKLGICVLAGASNAATVILLFGNIRADSLFPSFTVGAPVFLSAATAGALTSTAPTGTTDFVVRCVGFANTADELFWNPSNDYITLV
jgi:hypothetical protein